MKLPCAPWVLQQSEERGTVGVGQERRPVPEVYHHTRQTLSGTMSLLLLQLNALANSWKFWREPITLWKMEKWLNLLHWKGYLKLTFTCCFNQRFQNVKSTTVIRFLPFPSNTGQTDLTETLLVWLYLNFPGLCTSTLMELTACSGRCVPHHTWKKKRSDVL